MKDSNAVDPEIGSILAPLISEPSIVIPLIVPAVILSADRLAILAFVMAPSVMCAVSIIAVPKCAFGLRHFEWLPFQSQHHLRAMLSLIFR